MLALLLTAQTVLWSLPTAPVCTSAPVSSVTVAWDGIPTPQTLALLDGSGSVTWYALDYRITLVGGAVLTVPLATPEATVTVNPPAVACVIVQAAGQYTTIPQSPPAAPANVRVIGSTTPPPPSSAAWSSICETVGFGSTATSTCASTLIEGRGFAWTLPFDPVNGEFLTYMASAPDTGIYSSDLIGISARMRVVTKRVDRAASTDYTTQCWAYGGPAASQNPPRGHPLGFSWFDSGVNQWLTTLPLCIGYSAPQTARYDAKTRAMLPLLAAWPFAPNQYGSVAWDSGAVYVPALGKAILCCGDTSYSMRVFEFSSASGTYANVSESTKGADNISCTLNGAYPGQPSTHCPTLSRGLGLVTDGTVVYAFGGERSNGATLTDLYQYDPASRVMTKVVPVDGVLPPATHAAFPLTVWDSTRSRLVFVTESGLWVYTPATNRWTQTTASGSGPVLDASIAANPYSKACGYDPVQDAVVCVVSRGQSAAPDIRVLQFSGS